MTDEELSALMDVRFPGGVYEVAHWENFLLTDCTGSAKLPDGLVHPIALFHMPILGAGTSISTLFTIMGATGAGSVSLLGYDWEYVHPLRQSVPYRCDGGIVHASRRADAEGRVSDDISFRIDLYADDLRVASITNRWRLNRTDVTRRPSSSKQEAAQPTADDGSIPSWTMESVDPARMKTMAAVLRDPYPVHWDRDANERIGLGRRVVNQGPLNVGYIANMLMAWAGPTAIARLTLSFGRPVLDGERVTAHGVVTGTDPRTGHTICDVWLERDGERVVTGTAEVRTGSTDHQRADHRHPDHQHTDHQESTP